MKRYPVYGLALVALATCGFSPFVLAQDAADDGAYEAGAGPGAPAASFVLVDPDTKISDLTVGQLLTVLNPPANIPEEAQDPAFAQYVDLGLLTQAWAYLDPVLMTDVALQLAEGERVLLRKHKSLSSSELLKMAAKMAAESNDQTTLGRIKQAATDSGNEALTTQIAATEKLSAGARSAENKLVIPIGLLTSDQYADLQSFVMTVRADRLAGDDAGLQSLEGEASLLEGLSDEQTQGVNAMISDARTAVAEGEQMDTTASTLNKLNAASRTGSSGWGNGHGGGHHSGHGGGHGSGHGGGHGSGHGSGWGGGHGSGWGGGHGGWGGGHGGWGGGHSGGSHKGGSHKSGSHKSGSHKSGSSQTGGGSKEGGSSQ